MELEYNIYVIRHPDNLDIDVKITTDKPYSPEYYDDIMQHIRSIENEPLV